jgi:hypothetical protein
MNLKVDAQIGVAIFLGGTIGAKLAQTWETHFYLGIILGAIAGWILSDPMRFLRAVKRAFEESVAWGPAFVQLWIWLFVSVTTIWAAFFTVVSLLQGGIGISFDWHLFLWILGVLGLFGSAGLAAGEVMEIASKYPANKWSSARKTTIAKHSNYAIRYFNPIAPVVWVIYWLLRSISWLYRRLEAMWAIRKELLVTTKLVGIYKYGQFRHLFLPAIVSFADRTIRYHHSKLARLSLIWSAVGGTLGWYLADKWFIGVLIGAVLAVADYEVVGVRWLKVADSKLKFGS